MEADEQECQTKAKWRFILGGLTDTDRHKSRVKIIKRRMRNARRSGLYVDPIKNLTRRLALALTIGFFLTACTKEWSCVTEVHTSDFQGNEYVIETETTFHGTTAEKNDLEATSTPDKTIECH